MQEKKGTMEQKIIEARKKIRRKYAEFVNEIYEVFEKIDKYLEEMQDAYK